MVVRVGLRTTRATTRTSVISKTATIRWAKSKSSGGSSAKRRRDHDKTELETTEEKLQAHMRYAHEIGAKTRA